MEFLPIVCCSPALKTLEFNDRVRGQDSIFIALAQHPCIADIALTLTLDLDIVTSALATPEAFASLRSLNVVIRFAAADDMLSALPQLESLTMHVYDIDTQSIRSITDKFSELGRLQDLTLIVNRPVSISLSSLTPLKQLPRLTKLCLEEEISNNIDISQLAENDLISFLADIHLQHLHVRLSFLNDSFLGHRRTDATTSLNHIGRDCPTLRVLELPGDYSIEALDTTSHPAFPDLQHLEIQRIKEFRHLSLRKNHASQAIDTWANKLTSFAPHLRHLEAHNNDCNPFDLFLEGLGHWTISRLDVEDLSSNVRTRAPRCLTSM